MKKAIIGKRLRKYYYLKTEINFADNLQAKQLSISYIRLDVLEIIRDY